MENARAFKVEILTRDHGIVPLDLTPFARGIQAIVVDVEIPGGNHSRCIVVNAFQNAIPQADRAEVARHLATHFTPEATVIFDLEDREGYAGTHLEPSTAPPEVRQSAAAAVAAVKRNWGWDESPEIVIRIANTSGNRRMIAEE